MRRTEQICQMITCSIACAACLFALSARVVNAANVVPLNTGVLGIVPMSTRSLGRSALTGVATPSAESFDGLLIFGIFAISLLLICRLYQQRFPWLILGMALGALLAAIYGFLQGAWPLGVAMAFYYGSHMFRLRSGLMSAVRRVRSIQIHQEIASRSPSELSESSRLGRLFGRS